MGPFAQAVLLVMVVLLGLLTSPVSAQALSVDASLSDLTLSQGRLDPAFASATTEYSVSVGYTVTRISVTVSLGNNGASFTLLNAGDSPLPDRDIVTPGHQINLGVGENVLKVRVTAEDNLAMRTYVVTVTRTQEDTSLSPTNSDPPSAFASSAVYGVTFTGAWTSAVTPDGVPSGAHFSPLIGAIHNASVTFVEGGGTASAGIQSMAEVGETAILEAELTAALANAPSVLKGSGNVSTTGTQNLTAALSSEHPRVSLLTMVAPSHDWFVGVSGLPLLDASGRWLRSHEVDLFPWDAGTEDGTDFALSPSVATTPQGSIESIRGTGKFSIEPIAGLRFELRSIKTTRGVAENTAVGVDIGAPVAAADVNGTVTYTLGGTDAASFDIVASSGQLQTKAALDYETKPGYEVTIMATDASGAVDTTVTIEVTNVIELASAISGPASPGVVENQAGRVATYVASSAEDRGGITWSLSGADADDFNIDAPGGALRFQIDPVAPIIFARPPDFEAPSDANMDNEYTLTVTASVGTESITSDVAVTVTNENEAGALTLSSTRPRLGSALTTTLSDLDTGTGTATWTWERSAGRSAWSVIDDAASSTYTPVAADTGHFLRVKASYAGQTVSAVAAEVVVAALLSHLAVTTDDSVGGGALRQLKPTFDGGTLHYAVGCGNADTMALTLSAAMSETRVAVNGIQTASQNASIEVKVNGTSVVPITLTDSEGASTTYIVHCIPSDFGEVTTIKRAEAGVIEDLIMFGRHYGSIRRDQKSYLTIIDNNGVPRYLRRLSHRVNLFFRPHQTPDGEWRYSYGNRNNAADGEIVLLDQSLDEVARVTTVAPLTVTNYHDHHILDDDNYLLMAYQPATRDLSHLQGFLDQNGDPVTYGIAQRVNDSAIQIRTPDGVALFTWSSWDAIPLEDCAAHRFPPHNGDYAHINGLQLYDGDIIATFRGCSTVLRIDRELDATHKVVWRLGRSNLSDEQWLASDKGPPPLKFVGDPEGEFCGMHAGQLLANGNLLIFDNGTDCVINGRTRESKRESFKFSRAVEYAIDEANGEAVFQRAHSLHDTDGFLTKSSGHVEDLANGDWLISWGRSASTQELSDGYGARPDESATQVDPDTGVEKFSIRVPDPVVAEGQQGIRALSLSPVALAAEPTPLTAVLADSSHHAVFNAGAPQIAVAFSRPVADFAANTPSVSIEGATVASVAAHVVAGEPANSYLFTFTPLGPGLITFRLVADQACAGGGICTADGSTLSAGLSVTTAAADVGENNKATPISYPAGDTVVGPDGDKFELVSGVLRFRATPDYEFPADNDGNNTYLVSIVDTDGALPAMLAATITVTDVNEEPLIDGQSTITVAENFDATLNIYAAMDPEGVVGFTWSLDGVDAGDFMIGENTGKLSFRIPPDFDKPPLGNRDNVYSVIVQATEEEDGDPDTRELTGRLAVTVMITPVNEPPSVTGPDRVSIEEEGPLFVGTYEAADQERANIAWLPLDGSDNDKFKFNSSTGRLEFKAAPDYEDARDSGRNNVYDVTLGASAGGQSTMFAITVSVKNKDEFDSLSFSSPQPQADADYTATLSDPDKVLSAAWTWERSTSSSGPWNAVSGATGGLTTSDYRPDSDDVGYYLRVSATYADGHGPNKGAVQRSANPVRAAPVTNDPPSFDEPLPSRSIAEDAGVDARVGNPVMATDPGDVLTYELSGSVLFKIDGNSGQIRVADNSLDHETVPLHSVTVKASDTSNAFDTVTVTITVDDVNEHPDVFADTGTVSEDGDVIIDVLDNDTDQEDDRSDMTLRVFNLGPDAPRNGTVTVNEPANVGDRRTITYEPNANYNGSDSFTYQAWDTGSPSLSSTASVSIEVNAVNDSPMFTSLTTTRSVDESARESEMVGSPVAATDVDENDTLTYSLLGTDEGSFDIDPRSAQIAVGGRVTFDIALKDSYTVIVEVVDAAGSRAKIDVAISVTSRPSPRRGGGGGGRRPPGPVLPVVDYALKVVGNSYVQERFNQDLKHNIPHLKVTFSDGRVAPADFLGHYDRTGGKTRWGYPTSEVLVLEDGTLTQFYQRGVVDFHDVGAGWVVERRLAWDYVGGGEKGAPDQGVEPDVLNQNSGTRLGPWGHKISDFAIDGTVVGFAGFFDRLGGTAAFGLPKTDARVNNGDPGMLLEPNKTRGFTRQYFQAAVFEFHPNDQSAPVKLSLLGDTLRGVLVPDYSDHPPFRRTLRLVEEQVYEPYAVPQSVS